MSDHARKVMARLTRETDAGYAALGYGPDHPLRRDLWLDEDDRPEWANEPPSETPGYRGEYDQHTPT